jgi:hypothetical protein
VTFFVVGSTSNEATALAALPTAIDVVQERRSELDEVRRARADATEVTRPAAR